MLHVLGEIREVGGTGYDLRSPRKLADAFKDLDVDGYDINFCLNNSLVQPGFNFAARYYIVSHCYYKGSRIIKSELKPLYNNKVLYKVQVSSSFELVQTKDHVITFRI